MIIASDTLLWALSFGALPAIVWLLFWLREDKKHPEPLHIIIACFLFGGISVIGSIFLEKLSLPYVVKSQYVMVLVWAGIEEVLKFFSAKWGGLTKGSYNEPIDAVVYLLAAALGFAAIENTLYLLDPFGSGNFLEGIVVSNFRFIGASMLHFLSSVVLGSFIAFAFYKSPRMRRIYTLFGLSTAIALHAVFNLLIIKDALKHTTVAFIVVWICIIVCIGLFERIKRLSPLSEEIK